jgi:IMP cyclohydrolase
MNNQTASKRIAKRISKVTVKRMVDTDPDTSYLGEYSNDAETEYAIDRKHSQDCQNLEENHRQAVDQLERVIAYLETVRQAGEPPENVYWSAADESQDVLIELQDELQECDCNGGDMERNEYRYFNGNVENYPGNTPEDIRKYVRQDYERMERLNRGDWCYIGIRAEAKIMIDNVCQKITSGGLWGVESDSSREYFAEIEAEELYELRKQLTAVGFSKRAIATACKNIERMDD